MVVPIIEAQFALLVGESKVARKQLGVGRKAGIQGIAPAVNDPRVRKDPVNGPEMEKIAKILVDKRCSLSRALSAMGCSPGSLVSKNARSRSTSPAP
jgi:hypothetical protein